MKQFAQLEKASRQSPQNPQTKGKRMERDEKLDSSVSKPESSGAKSAMDSSALDSSVALESPESSNAESALPKSSVKPPRAQKLIDSAYDLSLGISIVVAILLGLGAGILLQKLTGSVWGLGVGVFWGVGAAILNIYKAYKRTQKSLEDLANDPKYRYKKEQNP